MADVADVVIIGGGCTGTSTAWQLAKRRAGHIVLLEKLGLAMGATGRSSAIVRMHYTHEAPTRLAQHSLGIFERFGELVGGDASFRQTGCLVLVGERDLAAVTANVEMHQRVGVEARVVRPNEIAQIEPRLNLEGVGAAAWEPKAGYADPVGTTLGYAEAARELGVELRIGVEVAELTSPLDGVWRIATSAGPIETRTVVVAAGYRSCELVAPHGLELPITPIRHTQAVVERSAAFGPAHPIILDHAVGGSFRPEGSALTLVGSPLAGDPEDPEIEVDRTPSGEMLDTLVAQFVRRFPGEGAAVLRRSYTGVFDCTPDMQPMLGAIPNRPGLFVAAGFSGHGFKLSPAIGQVMAEAVLDQRSSLIDLDEFSPARFVEHRPIGVVHPYSLPTLG